MAAGDVGEDRPTRGWRSSLVTSRKSSPLSAASGVTRFHDLFKPFANPSRGTTHKITMPESGALFPRAGCGVNLIRTGLGSQLASATDTTADTGDASPTRCRRRASFMGRCRFSNGCGVVALGLARRAIGSNFPTEPSRRFSQARIDTPRQCPDRRFRGRSDWPARTRARTGLRGRPGLALSGRSALIVMLRLTSRVIVAGRGVQGRRRACHPFMGGGFRSPGRGRLVLLACACRPLEAVVHAFGMPAGQAKGATAFVLATKFVALRRVVSGFGSVTHFGQFSSGEQLQLPHGNIVPDPGRNHPVGSAFDHAKFIE